MDPPQKEGRAFDWIPDDDDDATVPYTSNPSSPLAVTHTNGRRERERAKRLLNLKRKKVCVLVRCGAKRLKERERERDTLGLAIKAAAVP